MGHLFQENRWNWAIEDEISLEELYFLHGLPSLDRLWWGLWSVVTIVSRSGMRVLPVGFTPSSSSEDRSVVILLVEVAVVMGVVGESVAIMWGRLVRLLIVCIMVIFWVERIVVLIIPVL